jgi:hypothetical protein
MDGPDPLGRWLVLSFSGAYGSLTKPTARWLSRCGQTLGRIANETIRAPKKRKGGPAMDIERINQIGSGLADLSARTEALRGYL